MEIRGDSDQHQHLIQRLLAITNPVGQRSEFMRITSRYIDLEGNGMQPSKRDNDVGEPIRSRG
jgi:hypothetical protein